MFDWFWEFLYSISKILFQIIDGMVSIANMLCGIEPMTVDGNKTDFLSFLLGHDKIMYGFIGAAFIGIFLIMVFSIFAIIKSVKGSSDLPPTRVAINVFKTLGIFLFVPFIMIAFTQVLNELMGVLYKATSYGSSTMGEFLFISFLPDGVNAEGAVVDYTNTDSVWSFLSLRGSDLSDYKFFFSWLCCIPLLFALAKGLLNFVDRTISIVLLFIVSPISISSSIVDDGAHFKLWREQVLIKFMTGYGIIIGLNIYILIVSIISSSNVVFFESDFLNFLFKVAFCLGGAVSLERTMALAGNLVSSGAGSNELRDSAIAYNSMKGIASGIGKLAKGIAKAPVDIANARNDIKHKGLGQTLASSIGLKTDRDYKMEGYGHGSGKPMQEQILDAIVGIKDSMDSNKNKQENDNISGNDAPFSMDKGDQNFDSAPTSGNSNNKFMDLISGADKPDTIK